MTFGERMERAEARMRAVGQVVSPLGIAAFGIILRLTGYTDWPHVFAVAVAVLVIGALVTYIACRLIACHALRR